MKKIILGLSILSVILSCNNSSSDLSAIDSPTNIKGKQISNVSKFSGNELDEFKNDQLVSLFRENYYGFLESLKDENYEQTAVLSKQGNDYLEELFKKYGKEKTVELFDEVSLNEKNNPTDSQINKIFGTQDGSSCTRNLDGSVYWGNCSFWEGASAYVNILIHCGYVNPQNASQSTIQIYLNCNQTQICKYC